MMDDTYVTLIVSFETTSFRFQFECKSKRLFTVLRMRSYFCACKEKDYVSLFIVLNLFT